MRAFIILIVFLHCEEALLAAEPAILHLKCGIYKAKGFFALNKNNQFIFTVHRNSFSAKEFLIIGGDAKEKLMHTNKVSEIQFYVPNTISSGSTTNLVFLMKFNKVINPFDESIQLLSEEGCGKNLL